MTDQLSLLKFSSDLLILNYPKKTFINNDYDDIIIYVTFSLS